MKIYFSSFKYSFKNALKVVGLSLLITLGLTPTNSANAQSDVQSWSSIMLSGKINNRFTYGIRPVLRHDLTNGDVKSTTLDLLIKYKFKKGVSIFVLNRNGISPSGRLSNLLLTDLRHSFKISENIAMTNSFRFHTAYKFQAEDSNYLCFLSSLKFFSKHKLSSSVGVHYFYRFDGFNEFTRVRLQLGLSYKLSSKFKFNINFWRTEKYIEDGKSIQLVLLPSLIYKI